MFKKLRLPLFLNVYNSPFKPPKLRWYFGKIAIGVPYFLPRVWKKFTAKDCIEHATKSMKNKNLIKKSFGEWYDYYKGYRKPVTRKIGFDFVDLGYKTKWSSTDFRFESRPVWSFVAFGYQIAVQFVAVEEHHFWEMFIYYHFCTDKKLSKQERVNQCLEKNPCTWHKYEGNVKVPCNFYNVVLKEKYLK